MPDESPDYNPARKNQHAQLLFDNFDGSLPDLYVFLSRKNIDANVTPHQEITDLFHAENAKD